MSQERRAKIERIHKRKFMDGRISPEDMWRSMLKGPCGKCGAKAVMQLRIFIPVNDFIQEMPGLAMQKAREHDGLIPVVEFLGPGGEPRKFVRALHAFACRDCRKELEHFAAQAPSYAVCEIDHGPGDLNRVTVGVAG